MCGVHTTSNFNDLNRLFFKLHLINHPYKILGKSEMFKASNWVQKINEYFVI